MAIYSIDHFSHALQRLINVKAVIPNDVPEDILAQNPHFQRPMKLLFLLHGYSGSNTDWLYNTPIMELAGRLNLAVVFPEGENSFYLDGPQTGRQYGTYIGEELPAYFTRVFHLSDRREDTLIAGFSMGGFGAIHTALAYPQRFSRVAAFCAALIQRQVAEMQPDSSNEVANYDYYKLVFHPITQLPESSQNPEVLLSRLMEHDAPRPGLFLCIGKDDFLYESNRQFCRLLEEHGYPFCYRESAGHHDFRFVNQYLEEALTFLLEESL